MGCSSPQNAGQPNIPATHLNRLLQVSQIGHQLNVNKKYEHLSKIELSLQTGSGFRKTYAYYGLTTKEQTEAKRKQFWGTTRLTQKPDQVVNHIFGRQSNKPSIQRIVNISQNIEQTAIALLHTNKLSMLNNSIQMCVDTKFNKYQIPIFCINEPISYSTQKIQDKDLNMEYEDQKFQLTIRSAKYPNGDIKMNEQLSCQIDVIKGTIRAMKQLQPSTKIRLFYNGREMLDDKTLGNYNFKQGTVIQAMIL